MDSKSVGQTIAHLRQQAGFTQKGLADRLFISDKAVSKWERGLSLPDAAYWGKLSVLLDTDIDTILEGKPVYRQETWKGFLFTGPRSRAISLQTRIYDKPLVYFLLSYFFLAGIGEVMIACTEEEEAFLRKDLGNGERLGATLSYCRIENEKGTSEILDDNHPFFMRSNVMTVFGNSILHGANLTYIFQRAMLNHNRNTVLAIPTITADDKRVLWFDEERKITKEAKIKTKYDHVYLPILFSPGEFLVQCFSGLPLEEITLTRMTEEHDVYVDVANRGLLEMKLSSSDDLLEASGLVKTMQKHMGLQLGCLEEIAWRRNMIDELELSAAARRYEGTDLGIYLHRLIDKT